MSVIGTINLIIYLKVEFKVRIYPKLLQNNKDSINNAEVNVFAYL